ncbi:hypothetical protein SAMN03080602_00420 [Arenibacter troitsensis]|uniref:Uncharacterized protein n=1 Tax=Arenibacter troitsensis TaxID=188872 RepID=A0A1X7I5D6_9FLAO|nr:hypothetical protein SAMN03080602_00420 [Arenibacter troitsensis]
MKLLIFAVNMFIVIFACFGITSLQNEVIFLQKDGCAPVLFFFFGQILWFIFENFSVDMVLYFLVSFGKPNWLTSLVYQIYVI